MDLEETLRNLRERLAGVAAELRQINTDGGAAPLDEVRQARWTELETEHATVTADIARTEARLRLARELLAAGTVETVTPPASPEVMRQVEPFDGAEVRSLTAMQARDKALKALELREVTSHLDTRQVDHLERMLRVRSRNTDGTQIARRLLITENVHYRSAFMKLVTRPGAVLTSEEGRAVEAFDELRAMNIGTDADGGYGVPVVIDPTIILTAQGHPNDFFAISRVETITTDKWKGVSSAGATWSFGAEGSTATDSDPTLAGPEVKAHRATGNIEYTIEVGMDYPGFAAEMATLLASGYSEILVDKFTRGTGDANDQPTGLVTKLGATPASQVEVTTAGAISAADVLNAWEQLPIRFRKESRWMSSTSVQSAVRLLGATEGAEFTVDLTAEGILQLIGHPYLQNDYMPAFTGAVGTENYLAVGDFRHFLIAQRAGMSIELIPHVVDTATGRPTGKRAWFAWARVGSDVIVPNAFRLLKNKAA